MSEPIEDRPASLPRRLPKPSPDERVDPVDPPAPAPSPSPKKGRKREMVTVLSTRLSQDVQDILDRAVEEHGLTVRSAVEEAIKGYWSR